MSEPYYIGEETTPVYQAPPQSSSNTAGLIGFILSIVSLATCGVLSPIALLVSVFGLFKQPRGLASAGAVISGLTTLAIGGFFLMMALASKASYDEVQSAVMKAQTRDSLKNASRQIEQYRDEHGELPLGVEGNKLILSHQDAWGNALLYEYEDESLDYAIRSLGPDGELGTGDDQTFRPTEFTALR